MLKVIYLEIKLFRPIAKEKYYLKKKREMKKKKIRKKEIAVKIKKIYFLIIFILNFVYFSYFLNTRTLVLIKE